MIIFFGHDTEPVRIVHYSGGEYRKEENTSVLMSLTICIKPLEPSPSPNFIKSEAGDSLKFLNALGYSQIAHYIKEGQFYERVGGLPIFADLVRIIPQDIESVGNREYLNTWIFTMYTAGSDADESNMLKIASLLDE